MLGVPRAALQCVALADSTTDSFYTRHLLHPFTHFFAGNLLHQTTFAPETLYEGSLLHQVFYTRHLLPPKAFCTKCIGNAFYTRHILHQIPLTPGTFYTRHFLNHAPYPPEQCFHENSLGRSWLNILDTFIFGISRYSYFSWQ